MTCARWRLGAQAGGLNDIVTCCALINSCWLVQITPTLC